MSVVERAIAWALCVANDDSHGYSQDANKRFAGVDYDCSSFVITAYKQAGVPLTSTFTGNMKKDFLAHGFVEVPLKSKQRGDVLLNEAHHTAIYIGDNKIVHASSSETGGKYGKEGDQTGREICVRSYYDYPWNCVLRYTGDTPSTDSKGVQKVNIELPVLREESTGEEVKTVQRLLNEMGYRDQNGERLTVDGSFKSKTLYAIRKFQTDYRGKNGQRLEVDGVIGANTWRALLT